MLGHLLALHLLLPTALIHPGWTEGSTLAPLGDDPAASQPSTGIVFLAGAGTVLAMDAIVTLGVVAAASGLSLCISFTENNSCQSSSPLGIAGAMIALGALLATPAIVGLIEHQVRPVRRLGNAIFGAYAGALAAVLISGVMFAALGPIPGAVGALAAQVLLVPGLAILSSDVFDDHNDAGAEASGRADAASRSRRTASGSVAFDVTELFVR